MNFLKIDLILLIYSDALLAVSFSFSLMFSENATIKITIT